MSQNLEKEKEGLDLMIAYRQCFSTPAGEKVLADLQKRFNDRSSYVHGDPHGTSMREGERNVYLQIRHMLNVPEDKINERIENVRVKKNTK
jgi:hypothetical protein